MKAQDIMTEQVITVKETAEIEYARSILMEEDISSLPVTNDLNELTGIITQTDFFNLQNLFQNKLFDDEDYLSEVHIGDVMTRSVVKMGPGATLLEVSQAMVENAVHRVVIVKDKDEVMGVVSVMDVLKAGVTGSLSLDPPTIDWIQRPDHF